MSPVFPTMALPISTFNYPSATSLCLSNTCPFCQFISLVPNLDTLSLNAILIYTYSSNRYLHSSLSHVQVISEYISCLIHSTAPQSILFASETYYKIFIHISIVLSSPHPEILHVLPTRSSLHSATFKSMSPIH